MISIESSAEATREPRKNWGMRSNGCNTQSHANDTRIVTEFVQYTDQLCYFISCPRVAYKRAILRLFVEVFLGVPT